MDVVFEVLQLRFNGLNNIYLIFRRYLDGWFEEFSIEMELGSLRFGSCSNGVLGAILGVLSSEDWPSIYRGSKGLN